MKKTLLTSVIVTSFLSGCASVPMESVESSDKAKKFNPPSPDAAGIYIYRADNYFGQALKKDVWINKECIGETARGVFFYHEVEGGKEHTISTESEFSPNDIIIEAITGDLYFIEQYIKLGAFVGGAGLEKKESNVGKQDIALLNMASKGKCSE